MKNHVYENIRIEGFSLVLGVASHRSVKVADRAYLHERRVRSRGHIIGIAERVVMMVFIK